MNENKTIELYEKISKELIHRNLQISTMESCTAGLIASLLTNIDGSSQTLKGAYVTYSNEAKIKCGVSKNIIDTYGVYSEETAIDMAHSCVTKYSSDIGIGVTGTIGKKDPENTDSIAGDVYYAIIFNGKLSNKIVSNQFCFSCGENRFKTKMDIAFLIGEVLMNELNNL